MSKIKLNAFNNNHPIIVDRYELNDNAQLTPYSSIEDT